jgi:hypothetical protein
MKFAFIDKELGGTYRVAMKNDNIEFNQNLYVVLVIKSNSNVELGAKRMSHIIGDYVPISNEIFNDFLKHYVLADVPLYDYVNDYVKRYNLL